MDKWKQNQLDTVYRLSDILSAKSVLVEDGLCVVVFGCQFGQLQSDTVICFTIVLYFTLFSSCTECYFSVSVLHFILFLHKCHV